MASIIDVNFDFTTDTPHFWDNFWDQDNILGTSRKDPDVFSATLQRYQKILYSKKLPNGQNLDLVIGKGQDYLNWKDMRFASDSIIASFRYKNNRRFLEKVARFLPDYKKYMENYIHKAYTIGGEIFFPKRRGGINQARGCNRFIRDRWDLTLECIRKYYNNEHSPLYDVIKCDKKFFDLFVDFKGYVDFFYLQDLVSSDYSKINFWLGDGTFTKTPLPDTVENYLSFISKELEFVRKRNQRIYEDCFRTKEDN